MNFFRSEEHLRRWEGFQEKKKGGIIPLNSLMQLFSGPFFTNRGRPDYVSHMSEYMADFIGELDKLQGAGDYWKLSPIEKFGFNLAMKLGLM
jgi:hypothetical protein